VSLPSRSLDLVGPEGYVFCQEHGSVFEAAAIQVFDRALLPNFRKLGDTSELLQALSLGNAEPRWVCFDCLASIYWTLTREPPSTLFGWPLFRKEGDLRHAGCVFGLFDIAGRLHFMMGGASISLRHIFLLTTVARFGRCAFRFEAAAALLRCSVPAAEDSIGHSFEAFGRSDGSLATSPRA